MSNIVEQYRKELEDVQEKVIQDAIVCVDRAAMCEMESKQQRLDKTFYYNTSVKALTIAERIQKLLANNGTGDDDPEKEAEKQAAALLAKVSVEYNEYQTRRDNYKNGSKNWR